MKEKNALKTGKASLEANAFLSFFLRANLS